MAAIARPSSPLGRGAAAGGVGQGALSTKEEEHAAQPAADASPAPLLRARKSDVFDSEGFQAVAFINQIYPDGASLLSARV